MTFTTRSARFIERSDGSIVLSNAIGLASVSATMVDWVETQTAPTALVLNSANSSVSMPVCPYPQKATYNGIARKCMRVTRRIRRRMLPTY